MRYVWDEGLGINWGAGGRLSTVCWDRCIVKVAVEMRLVQERTGPDILSSTVIEPPFFWLLAIISNCSSFIWYISLLHFCKLG